MRQALTLIAILCAIWLAPNASASLWTEIGDADELPNVAQVTVGVGALTQLSATMGPSNDDVDMFEIGITDPANFSAIFSASLSQDNDLMVWLFDSAGSLIFSDDDDGAGYLPQINAGDIAGNPAGNYFLAMSLYSTTPIGDPITDWDRDPFPPQTGPYTIDFTGAQFAAPIPEPSTIAIWSLLGLIGLIWCRRRKAA